jgi:hypothetical protein
MEIFQSRLLWACGLLTYLSSETYRANATGSMSMSYPDAQEYFSYKNVTKCSKRKKNLSGP